MANKVTMPRAGSRLSICSSASVAILAFILAGISASATAFNDHDVNLLPHGAMMDNQQLGGQGQVFIQLAGSNPGALFVARPAAVPAVGTSSVWTQLAQAIGRSLRGSRNIQQNKQNMPARRRTISLKNRGRILGVNSKGQRVPLKKSISGRRYNGRSLAPQSEYCAISPNHTACIYTEPDQDGLCEGEVVRRGLKPKDIAYILKLHNDERRKAAQGKQPGQPPASNMAELTWDAEAASIAQTWADQCQYRHDQEMRTVGSEWEGGQNQHMEIGSPILMDFRRAIVDGWVGREVKLLTSDAVSANGRRPKGTGHYTQVVWADTRRVGCGYLQRARTHYFYCNYVEGGNIPDEPMYKIGTACKACPSDLRRCNSGLCSS